MPIDALSTSLAFMTKDNAWSKDHTETINETLWRIENDGNDVIDVTTELSMNRDRLVTFTTIMYSRNRGSGKG